jgi:hypothetical protein
LEEARLEQVGPVNGTEFVEMVVTGGEKGQEMVPRREEQKEEEGKQFSWLKVHFGIWIRIVSKSKEIANFG